MDEARDRGLMKKEQARKDRLALEAKAEFERRHSMRLIAAAKSSGMKLPSLPLPNFLNLKKKISRDYAKSEKKIQEPEPEPGAAGQTAEV